MRTATVKLQSVSPYGQSRPVSDEKLSKEGHAAYEERTWRSKMHVDKDGFVFVPPMALKNCLAEAAKFMSRQIPGKGKSTYTKHFEAGVLVSDPSTLGIKAEDVPFEKLFVPSSGRRGDGSRVWKFFPIIQDWECETVFHVLDDTITNEVFEEHLAEAGRFIGIGRFRPRNNGYYGRFEVVEVVWS